MLRRLLFDAGKHIWLIGLDKVIEELPKDIFARPDRLVFFVMDVLEYFVV